MKKDQMLTKSRIQHPMFAAIWVDYDGEPFACLIRADFYFLDTETVCSSSHNAITLLTDTSLLVIYEFRNVS